MLSNIDENKGYSIFTGCFNAIETFNLEFRIKAALLIARKMDISMTKK